MPLGPPNPLYCSILDRLSEPAKARLRRPGMEETSVCRAGRRRVLVVDSGIGGLTVVAAIRRHVPEAALLYLGDTALFPYGALAPGTVADRLVTLVGAIRARTPLDAAAIACNTASTAALADLRAAIPDLPIVGVVPPLKTAGAVSRSRVVALLATPATSGSAYVDELIAAFLPDACVLRPDCRGLAAEAEKKLRGEPVDAEAVAAPLAGLPADERAAVDTLVLGCTHYPWLTEELQAALGHPASVLDPAEPVAKRLAAVLAALQSPPSVADPENDDVALFTGADTPLDALAPALREAGFARSARFACPPAPAPAMAVATPG